MPTLNDNLRHMLKHTTSLIDPADVPKIHELLFLKAVFVWKAQGKMLIKLCKTKGAKSRVREFIRHGKVITN